MGKQKYNTQQRPWASRLHRLTAQDNTSQQKNNPSIKHHELRKMKMNLCRFKIKQNATQLQGVKL